MKRERLAVAAAVAVLLYLVFFRAGTFVFPFPTGSNGVFFDEAWRIVSGQVMYRDFFEFVGPGTAHLNAAVLWLFGPRVAALGYAAVGIGVFVALLLHELAARLAPRPWRVLAPLAEIAPDLVHPVTGIPLGLAWSGMAGRVDALQRIGALDAA